MLVDVTTGAVVGVERGVVDGPIVGGRVTGLLTIAIWTETMFETLLNWLTLSLALRATK